MEKDCRTWQDTDDNVAHAHCMLYTYVYKHTLRVCNTYCFFFIATMVGRTRLDITLYIRELPILFSFNEVNTSFSLPAFPLCTRLHGDPY